MQKHKKGFTLIELLVVIIIIVILVGITVALMNTFFRGTGVRQGGTQIIVGFAQAKQLAADQRVMHFLVLKNMPEGGVMTIHKDANQNKQFDSGSDPEIKGRQIELPKWVEFTTFPAWIGFNPTGYCVFSSGYSEINAGVFDNAAYQGTMPNGDIIIKVKNRPYFMCLDIDRGAGKIRRWFFLNQ